jgi:hypothetical protein
MIESTVPAAIATLQGYCQTVANAASLQSGPVGVYVGFPIGGNLPNAFFMVGDYSSDGNQIVANYGLDLSVRFPAGHFVDEVYQINLSIVCWSGASDPAAQTECIADTFSLMSALFQQIAEDPIAESTRALGNSGSWGSVQASTPVTGPFADSDGEPSGWGVVIEIAVRPINVQLSVLG